MAIEQVIRKSMEAGAVKPKKEGKSLNESLREPRAARLIGNFLPDEDLRKRVINNNYQASDMKALGDARVQAVEVMRKTDSVVDFLKVPSAIEYMAAIDPNFKKVHGVVGTEGMKTILNATYFEDLAQKNRPAFEKLVSSVQTYEKLMENTKSQDRIVGDIAKRFRVSPATIEEIIQTADPQEREDKMRQLVNATIPTWRLDRRMSIGEHIGSAQHMIQGLIQDNEKNIKSIAKSFNRVFAADTEFDEKMLAELQRESDAPEEPKEMSVEDMHRALENLGGKATQDKLAQARAKHAREALAGDNVVLPPEIESYWQDLKSSADPTKQQELVDFREEFKKTNPNVFPPRSGKRSLLREAFDAIFDDFINNKL